MRVAFAGTPPFAARILEAILAAGHCVPLVLTQPDRPAGRGLRLTASAVSELATRRSLPVDKPLNLKSDESRAPLSACGAEVLVVAAYGLILPKSVLAIPPAGCLNVHASLLPRWRGAAPIQRAILAGDSETGVGIMRMEPGLDTGPVLLEKRVTIGPEETAGTLTERLATEGSMAIVQVLANLETLEAKEQSEDGVTYAAKITKSESLIDWRSPADHVSRQVRAFNPSPGAFTHWAGEPLKVWEAFVVDGVSASPGAFVGTRDGFPIVACREGGLALTLVQPAGSKRMTGADFLKGRPVPLGSFLS